MTYLQSPPEPNAGYPAPYVPADEPRAQERRPLHKRIGGAIAAALALIANFAAKLKAVLLLLPKVKLLATSATMLVSIAAYSLIWGWEFAAGFVLLLLVHELGHVVQLRREGVPATAPMFIPFLGAVIQNKRMPKDAAAEARIGLAGPVLGTLGTLVPLALYGATGNEFWRALAFIGFFLNLINLLPVLPLDGGRAMAALSPWMWLAGFVLLAVGMIVFPTPIAVLVLIFGGRETYRRGTLRNPPAQRRYYAVDRGTRARIALTYVGLAVALGFGMHATLLVRHL
jgi:Zn-dependent protease